MKKSFKQLICAVLILVLSFCMISCKSSPKESELWETALYKEDTTFGDGEKTVYVKFRLGEKSIQFTLNTDKDTLGEALIENDIIKGEKGPYGMYVKEANGITADYNQTKSYWSFYKDSEYLTTGVDETEISDEEHYEIVYIKAK